VPAPDIQDLLINEGVDQLFIQLTKHEYTDVQYSAANLFYRCMVHGQFRADLLLATTTLTLLIIENIVSILTDEVFDTMSDLMSSPVS